MKKYNKIPLLFLLFALMLTSFFINFTKANASGEAIPIAVELDSFSGVVGGDSDDTLLWAKGNAAVTSSGLMRVVDAQNGHAGTVVRRNKMLLSGGFSTYFEFNMNSGSNPPADGLCFVIYSTTSTTPLVGAYGGGLGFSGIPNSIGVEFDTYYNNDGTLLDPCANHVAICLNGDNGHNPNYGNDPADNSICQPYNIYGQNIHVWVDYDGNTITVTFGTSSTRSDSTNVTTSRVVGSFLENQEVYVGFTASTGGCYANHDLLKWYFKNSYVSGGLSSAANSYTQAASTVEITMATAEDPATANIGIKDAGGGLMKDAQFELFLDGTSAGTFATDSTTGLYTYTIPDGLAGGTHTLKAVATSGGALNTASFQTPYTVSYNAGAHGTLSGSTSEEVLGGHYPTSVPGITADSGYAFAGWSSNGGTTILSASQVQNTAVSSNIAYTAYYSCTVSYDAGAHGSLSGSASESVICGRTPVSVPGVTADSGYTFAGWSSDGGTTILTTAQVKSTAISAGITYTAYYTCTVSYDAGAHGSLDGSASEEVFCGGSPASVPGITADSGYAFAGWSTDGGITLLSADAVRATTVTAAVSYTAYYSCTVSYDAGAHGSLDGSAGELVVNGKTATSVPDIVADSGYTFAGWSTDGGVTLLTAEQIETTIVTDNITYTAYYTCTVSYGAGAHGSLDGGASEEVLCGNHPASVPGITVDSGYSFAGWSTDSGTTLLSADAVRATTVTAAVSYTAYYSCTVTYDAGAHGSLDGSASDLVVNGKTAVSVPGIDADSGYTFAGWSTDGGSTLLTAAQIKSAVVTNNITYTAYYYCTVLYSAGPHGSLSGSPGELVVNGKTLVSVPGITAENGYTFAGWSTDGGNTLLTTAQVSGVMITANTTYTAYYYCTATYDAGPYGSLDGAASELVVNGKTPATVPGITAETGYTFAGWSCDSGATLLRADEVETVTITDNITFTAYYQCTVTYDPGPHGSLDGDASELVVNGQSAVSVPGITADIGYTFAGWSSDSGATLLGAGEVESLTITDNITFTAYYRCTVTYDAGAYGTLVGSIGELVVNGKTCSTIPDIDVNHGYVFTGWSNDGGTTLLTAAELAEVTISENVTYTAQYTKARYTVTYDAGLHGTLGGSASERVLYLGTPAAVPNITPDDMYLFAGWSSDGGHTILSRAEVDAKSVTDNITWVAQYTKKTYLVNSLGDVTLEAITAGYGYNTQEARSVQITRRGTGDLEGLTVSLSGQDASAFELTGLSATTLSQGTPSAAFTVTAANGLTAGTYTATVTVSAVHMEDVKFTVTQVVSESAAQTHEIRFVITDGSGVIPGATVTIGGKTGTTDENGEVRFNLTAGTYAYTVTRNGYSDTSGYFTVGEGTQSLSLPVGAAVYMDNDLSTPVTLIAGSGAVPDGSSLKVETLSTGVTGDTTAAYPGYMVAAVYDASLLMGDQEVVPGAPVTLGLPIPEDMQGRSCIVVRLNEDGSYTEITCVEVGGVLYIDADKLGTYAILINEDVPTGAAGVPAFPWWILIIAGAVLILLLVLLLWCAIIPVAESVTNNGDGTYTVQWGYRNQKGRKYAVKESASAVTALAGEILSGDAPPKEFEKGRADAVFSTVVRNGAVVQWKVNGRTARVTVPKYDPQQ